MKKLALALVAATTFVTAASADLTTGYYLGVGVGGNSVTAPFSVQNAAGDTISADVGRNRFEGSVYGGYGYVNGCTYLGAEAGFTFTGGKAALAANIAGTNYGFSVERRNIINAAFLIGQKFSPSTMFYIRLGMNSNQYREKGFTAAGVVVDEKKRKVSFAPGFGLEGAVTKNVRVRMQYVYDIGNSLPLTGKVKTQTVTLGVAYKF